MTLVRLASYSRYLFSVLSALLVTSLFGCDNKPSPLSSDNLHKPSNELVSAKAIYVRTVEGIEEFTLSNGLKVLLVADQTQPKTLVNITYRVGSVNEYYGETGMAHLLEHMLFKGSENYTDINEEFQKRGMHTNATTWLDRTNYFGVFEANEDTLAWTIGMEADRMVNATFTEADLQSEMTVVRNEMEQNENNPVRMLLSRMSSMAHIWHNYGNSTIGARSDVENFPFTKLRTFYKKHYRPDNAVLTIAGRFDKAKTLSLIEQRFGSIIKPEQPIEQLYTKEPTQDGERTVNLRRTGDIPVVGLMYHLPSGLHSDTAAITVLKEILSDYTRGRLQKQLVETELATGASAFSFLLKDSSQFIFIAQGAKDQNITDMENALITLAEHINNSPITEEEVKLAKIKLAKNAEQSMRNVTGIGMALSEYIAKGDYRHHFFFRDQIQTVTAAQVQSAAEKYLIQSNRTLGRFIPTSDPKRAELPETPDINALLKDYVGKEAIAAGEIYDNTVSNITKRLYTETWPQGTILNVYNKKRRGEEIIIRVSLPSGNLNSLLHQATAFDYISPLLKLGNEKYSKEVIANKLDELKSSIGFSSGAGTLSISVRTDKTHLTETLTLLKTLLTYPTFPDKELDVLKRSSISAIRADENDPSSIALAQVRQATYQYPSGHPFEFLSIDNAVKAINQITGKQLNALYQQHLSINHGYISVVGDVENSNISTLLQSVFSEFTSELAYEKLSPQYKDVEGINQFTETPDKANAQLYIVNLLNINKHAEDYLALIIANQIFGEDTFTSRIGKRIRVQEGFSYSVDSGIQTSEDSDHALYYAQAIAAPENILPAIKAYKEEVNKVVKNGFTQEELDNAKEAFIKNSTRQWSNDWVIANILIQNSKYHRQLSYYEEQSEKVKALTLQDIQTAFIKHIASKEINIFRAGDFTKSKIVD